MPAQAENAATFHKLHEELLILPNAWDAASARIVQDAGAKAIATSSAAVAWAQGYADGHHFPIENLIAVVEATARAVTIPITCDAEGGYSDDPKQAAENVGKLIDAGAVGINLEDGKQPHELHLKKIEAIRAVAEKKGVNLYINARTDVILKQLVPAEQAIEEALRRAAAIERAGGSGLFVPGIAEAAQISAVVQGTNLPLNIMARPGAPSAAQLRELGVRRLSAATGLFNVAMAAAREAAEDLLRDGDSEALWQRRGSPPDYNKLFGGQDRDEACETKRSDPAVAGNVLRDGICGQRADTRGICGLWRNLRGARADGLPPRAMVVEVRADGELGSA